MDISATAWWCWSYPLKRETLWGFGVFPSLLNAFVFAFLGTQLGEAEIKGRSMDGFRLSLLYNAMLI